MLRCALTIFDEHFPPDDAEDALAVSYLGGKISVSRKGDDLSKNGRRPVNGVLARLFYARKFTAPSVFCELSVQVLMKIKSGHVGTRELNTPDASQAGALGCEGELLTSELLPQSRFFGDPRNASFLISWSRKFGDPILLPDGRKLVTLRDAATYITKLPKKEADSDEWQAAIEALMLVAKSGSGPTMLARIGVMRALNRHVERVFNPDRKEHRWGKRKLARDR
jgi:hypothetical protein